MFKNSKIQQLLAGVVLVASLPLTAAAQTKDPVKIALVTSKSGGFSTMGADVANGIKFAVDEANAKGGVDGRKIIVAEGDDESTPDAGRRVAEKLAREGHNLIIGPITSGISLAISQNLARWDAAFIGTMSKADYDVAVADLVAYLQWMGEPAQNQRVRMGVWVLLFLAIFTFIAWRLNAAFWKDVK